MKDLNKLEAFITQEVNECVEAVFTSVHEYAKSKAGDISPEDSIKLSKIQKDLSDLILKQTILNL